MSRAEQFDPLPDDVAARWLKFGSWDRIFYPSFLGMTVQEVRADYCRMLMQYKPELDQPQGLVHGGAIASLLDAVVVPAVGAAYAREVRFSTVDMHVQYMSAAKQEDLIAEGWVTKRGRSVVFCESEAIGASSGKVVARSVLTYNVSA
ncbi:MAG: PaaI family thioesterase [Actinobacteria bacterium]|nr:PaaI family thioesterase [Actinomycetota bacterium]